MQAGHFTSLIPEQFRHKTTRVRIFQPQIILTDFHGTIVERRWEDQIITPYVQRTIIAYLIEHFNDDLVQNCLAALRQESFEVGIRHRYDDAPIIEAESDDLEPAHLAKQVGDFVLWQMRAKKETKESQILQKLVWLDGFHKKHILTPLYADVMPTLRKWHDEYNCKIYVTSSVDVQTLRVFMENTSHGSLEAILSGYLTPKKMGDKLLRQTYKKFYEQAIAPTHPAPPPPPPPPPTSPNTTLVNSPSNSLTSESTLAKPILFLTDSGQEAKAASSVLNGRIFDCLLVNRPGNKRIRSYYLSRFQYVQKFDDIEFV